MKTKTKHAQLTTAGKLIAAVFDTHGSRLGKKNPVAATRALWGFRLAAKRWETQVARDWDARPVDERTSYAGTQRLRAIHDLGALIQRTALDEFSRITATPSGARTYRRVTRKLADKDGIVRSLRGRR